MTPTQSSSVQSSSDQAIHPSLPTAENKTLQARRAVVYAVRHIRRWDEPGILAEWDKAADRGYDFAAVAVCLLESAADPGAKTPGVLLSRLANGWRREHNPPAPLPKLGRCETCQLRHAPGTPCGNPRRTEEVAAAIAPARAALEAAKADLCPRHGVPPENCIECQDEAKESA